MVGMCACGSPSCKYCNPNIWTDNNNEMYSAAQVAEVLLYKQKEVNRLQGELADFVRANTEIGLLNQELQQRVDELEKAAQAVIDDNHYSRTMSKKPDEFDSYGITAVKLWKLKELLEPPTEEQQ